MKVIGILIFGHFKWYRRLVGGNWARATKIAPGGPTIWLPKDDVFYTHKANSICPGAFNIEEYK